MADKTKIEWCHATVNHWAGCTPISPACDNCYAERMAGRLWGTEWGTGKPRHQFAGAADTLRALDRKAQRFGYPLRVFHNSLSDFFDNEVPVQWRINAMRSIVDTPNLIHLLLTKRIGNAAPMMEQAFRAVHGQREGWADNVRPNIWIGATICNQPEADRDIPKLLATPAAVRFLSIEPMLGDIRLGSCLQLSPSAAFAAGRVTSDMPAWTRTGSTAIDWVIVGGESGPNARSFHIPWPRSIVQQCKAAGVPVLVKQIGANPTGWCASRLQMDAADEADCDDDFCDFYEAHECSSPCAGRCAVLADRKGADMTEWPEDLRVREFPEARNG